MSDAIDWRCTNCGRTGSKADEMGMGRCGFCGHELDNEDEAWGATEVALKAATAEVARLNAELELVTARAAAAERGMHALFALACGKDDRGRLTVCFPGESGTRLMTFDGPVVDAMAALIEAGEKVIESEVKS